MLSEQPLISDMTRKTCYALLMGFVLCAAFVAMHVGDDPRYREGSYLCVTRPLPIKVAGWQGSDRPFRRLAWELVIEFPRTILADEDVSVSFLGWRLGDRWSGKTLTLRSNHDDSNLRSLGDLDMSRKADGLPSKVSVRWDGHEVEFARPW